MTTPLVRETSLPSLNHSKTNGGSPCVTAQITDVLLPVFKTPENWNGFTSGLVIAENHIRNHVN